MKIDRLIGILSVLLQKSEVTAPYLAEQFEVSRRTISRDIEDDEGGKVVYLKNQWRMFSLCIGW